MPIITKPASISKNVEGQFTLSKSSLAQVASVAADAYFSDSSNWSEVVVYYKSSQGNQKEVLKFDATQSSPTANFLVSAKSRNDFEVKKIVIFDFDGGFIQINRSQLITAEFDVTLSGSNGGGGSTPPLPNLLLTRDFSTAAPIADWTESFQPFPWAALTEVVNGKLEIAPSEAYAFSYVDQMSGSYKVRFHFDSSTYGAGNQVAIVSGGFSGGYIITEQNVLQGYFDAVMTLGAGNALGRIENFGSSPLLKISKIEIGSL